MNKIPFLPIGLANLWLHDAADDEELKELRKSGFNCTIPLDGIYQTDLNSFVDKACDNNIVMMLKLEGKGVGDIVDEVASMQRKTASICWIAEQKLISRFSVEEFDELALAVKGIAPAQPLAICVSPSVENVDKYMRHADIFMPIIGQNDDVCKVMDSVAKYGKTIVPVFKLDGSDNMVFGKVCAALMCGGRGLVLDCVKPEARETAFAVSEKLIGVAGIFTSQEEVKVKFSFSSCKIEPMVISRNWEGKHYIVCYNPDAKNVTLNFTVEDCDVAKRVVENSTITVGGTSFSDVLIPGQARIYRLERLFE